MKKVMILGAGLLQMFVIKKAKELGYKTIVLDMDKSAIGFNYADICAPINIVDKEACLEFARKNEIDGVLTAATDYGVITASYIAQEMNLPGLNKNTAEVIKNKYYVRKTLQEANADDTPQFFEISKMEDIKQIEKVAKFPLMVKPCDGSGSKGVCKVNSIEELEEAIKQALAVSIAGKVLVETFITGQEYGVESFVHKGNIYILGVMKKEMTKPPYYAELGHSIPSGLSEEMEKKVKQVVTKAIQSLKIDFGAVNMDLLIAQDNKVCIVDIGARMGGNLIGSHIIPLATGIDYMGNIIKAAVKDEPDFKVKYNKVVATHLLNLEPGIIEILPNLEKYEREGSIRIICKLKQGDKINTYKNNLDGCGYVVIQGQDLEECKQQAEEIKQQIDEAIVRKKDKIFC